MERITGVPFARMRTDLLACAEEALGNRLNDVPWFVFRSGARLTTMNASRNAKPRMALSAGTRLGPYEILAALGAGGMGKVYRARDAKLNRDVALKVLPESFASDSDRLARFKREARVLASLNHPNIAAIYGFEESDVVPALVMELVDGDTLADRLADRPFAEGGPRGVRRVRPIADGSPRGVVASAGHTRRSAAGG